MPVETLDWLAPHRNRQRLAYCKMEAPDPLLDRVSAVLAGVPGVVAIALGGSRASGAAHAASDYDLGLYFSEGAGLDVAGLLAAAKGLVDDPGAAAVTEVGGWSPWIVGGGWLRIAGKKLDLLYRPIESVERVIRDCREHRISIDYQPGHPHGFCPAIWMGEVALCRPLSDPEGVIAWLKSLTVPYPDKLREALIRRFQWEVRFSVENAETAVARRSDIHCRMCVQVVELHRASALRSEPALSHQREGRARSGGASRVVLKSIERELAGLTAATERQNAFVGEFVYHVRHDHRRDSDSRRRSRPAHDRMGRDRGRRVAASLPRLRPDRD
jgi:hypothetical protein